ncbi:MAG: exosortase/archaeosortase family protein [Ardenticatenaceae bacterium]
MIRKPIIFTLILALFLLLTFPVWRWLWGEWWNNDYYSHGILILLVSLYLAWRTFERREKVATVVTVVTTSVVLGGPQRLKSLLRGGERGENGGLFLLLCSLLAFLYFSADKAYYLAALAMILMLAGLLWSFGGTKSVREVAFPLAYLVLMVPLPFVERATLPLSLWTGTCSGYLVRWLGLDVTVKGAAVTLPNTELVIGAQCSGINSIMALTALTVLVAYLLEGPWWGRVALVALAIPLAMLGNIMRVANLLVVARYFGADAAFTFYHDYSGFLFFALILLLLIPISRLLQCKTLRLELL